MAIELTDVALSYGSSTSGTWTAYESNPTLITLPAKTNQIVDRTHCGSAVTIKGKGIADVSNMTARFEYTSALYTILEGQLNTSTDIYFKATIASGDYQIWGGQIFNVVKITEAGKPVYIDVESYSNTIPIYTAAT